MAKISKMIEVVGKWALHQGKSELLRFLNGGKLSWKEQCRAKCFECCCGYDDGAKDCKIPTCPLYGGMPYRDAKPEKKGSRTMSDEHKAKMAAARLNKKKDLELF
jgi:hypothetical protein